MHAIFATHMSPTSSTMRTCCRRISSPMTLHLHSSTLPGQGCLHGLRSRLPTARSPRRRAATHATPSFGGAYQPFAGGGAGRRTGISSPSLTSRRPMSKQPLGPVPDRDVSQHAELIFDYWCANCVGDAMGAAGHALLKARPDADAPHVVPPRCECLVPGRTCVHVCSDVNGNGPLESTLRSYRALALQLMRRTVTPENRPDAVRGVICMTYMVGHRPLARPLHARAPVQLRPRSTCTLSCANMMSARARAHAQACDCLLRRSRSACGSSSPSRCRPWCLTPGCPFSKMRRPAWCSPQALSAQW